MRLITISILHIFHLNQNCWNCLIWLHHQNIWSRWFKKESNSFSVRQYSNYASKTTNGEGLQKEMFDRTWDRGSGKIQAFQSFPVVFIYTWEITITCQFTWYLTFTWLKLWIWWKIYDDKFLVNRDGKWIIPTFSCHLRSWALLSSVGHSNPL